MNETSHDNFTESVMLYHPKPSHHGHNLVCTATNDHTPDNNVIQDKINLEIFCKYHLFLSEQWWKTFDLIFNLTEIILFTSNLLFCLIFNGNVLLISKHSFEAGWHLRFEWYNLFCALGIVLMVYLAFWTALPSKKMSKSTQNREFHSDLI